MKNLFVALALAMLVSSPAAIAQNSGESNATVTSGGAAGAGTAATAGYTTLAVVSSVALIGGAIALVNSGDDDENVDVGTTGTTGTTN